jgi:hypothetical protein
MATAKIKARPIAEKTSRVNKTEAVHIISYAGKNIVWPPVIVLDGGDTIRFRAVNTDATVFFKGALSFEGMQNDEEILKVPKKHVLAMKVKPKVLKKGPAGGLKPEGTEAVAGVYPYSVFCSEGNDFAEGNSSPVMILEPPDDDPLRGGGGG